MVGIRSRWIIVLAAFGLIRTGTAHAQLSRPSVVLPSDTSGARKLAPAKPPVTVAASEKAARIFAHAQLANRRVLTARTEKRFELKKLFRDRGLDYPAAEIFMRVFKREHQLEMWVRPQAADTFVLLKKYEICALNDKPGPKRVRGDEQTPEGFYYIDDFNPRSDYLLSLRVNYPNASDAVLGAGHPLGGDVFIHGGCKTAGCLAITDENIKEVYWLAVEARDQGQRRIPIHIFPARLSDNGLQLLGNAFQSQPELVRFWSNLKSGFDYFDQFHKLPQIGVNARGRYTLGRKDGLLGKPIHGADGLLGEPMPADTVARTSGN